MHQKVVIYRRQSRDRAHDELGIERQLEECQKLCERRGWPVEEVITDNDVSASKHGRAGYRRLIELVEGQQVDTIVILRIDRLLRLNDELEQLIQLSEERNTKVITVEGDIDLSTPSGRLVARLLVSVARAEIETKSARHKLAQAQAARAGKDHGGERPYGYEPDRVTIRVAEAEVLREMVRRFLNGYSTTAIAWWLNEHGHPMARGGQWASINVRNLLRRKRIGAIRVHNGAEYPAVWPAIIDKDTFERLQLEIRLRDQRPSTQKPKPRKYLLTGLVHCAKCGKPMVGNKRRDNPAGPTKPYYVCRSRGNYEREYGCGRTRRYAVPLEYFVKQALLYRFNSEALARAMGHIRDDTEVKALLEKRSTLLRIKREIPEMYANEELDRSDFQVAKNANDSALDAIDRQVVRQQQKLAGLDIDPGESLLTAWDNAENDEWRRRLLSLAIERIDLLPGRDNPKYWIDGIMFRFEPSRVDIIWKL